MRGICRINLPSDDQSSLLMQFCLQGHKHCSAITQCEVARPSSRKDSGTTYGCTDSMVQILHFCCDIQKLKLLCNAMAISASVSQMASRGSCLSGAIQDGDHVLEQAMASCLCLGRKVTLLMTCQISCLTGGLYSCGACTPASAACIMASFMQARLTLVEFSSAGKAFKLKSLSKLQDKDKLDQSNFIRWDPHATH